MRLWSAIFILLFIVQSIEGSMYHHKIVVKIEKSIAIPEYINKARDEALSALSYQLSSLVTSQSIFTKEYNSSDKVEKFEKHYTQNIKISSSLPIIAPEVISERVKDGKYYLVLEMNFDKSGPIYKEIAEDILENINKQYSFFLKLDGKSYKKKQLKKIIELFFEYKMYARISRIMGYRVEKKPIVSLSDIEINLQELNSQRYLGEPIPYDGYNIYR